MNTLCSAQSDGRHRNFTELIKRVLPVYRIMTFLLTNDYFDIIIIYLLVNSNTLTFTTIFFSGAIYSIGNTNLQLNIPSPSIER